MYVAGAHTHACVHVRVCMCARTCLHSCVHSCVRASACERGIPFVFGASEERGEHWCEEIIHRRLNIPNLQRTEHPHSHQSRCVCARVHGCAEVAGVSLLWSQLLCAADTQRHTCCSQAKKNIHAAHRQSHTCRQTEKNVHAADGQKTTYVLVLRVEEEIHQAEPGFGDYGHELWYRG